MGGRVTLEDIAEASNASPATVSLALRNKPGVSHATRERVLAVALSLGYQRPVRHAAMNGHELRQLALVFRTWHGGPERAAPPLNRFYSWVLAGIQDCASAHHLNLMLATIPVDARNQPRMLPEKVLRQPLDGVLVIGSFRPETITAIHGSTAARRPPLVLVDAEYGDADCVISDHARGAKDATTYLLQRGHTRLAYFGPSSRWEPNFRQRRDGFVRTLADHGVTAAGIIEPAPTAAVSDAARDALATIGDATAVVCGNDDYAVALLRAAQQVGRQVPDDLSIVGFDDTDLAVASVPPLTTMAVDKLSLGRLAIELLEYRSAHPEAAPVRITLCPRLVERATVSAVREGGGITITTIPKQDG